MVDIEAETFMILQTAHKQGFRAAEEYLGELLAKVREETEEAIWG